MSAPALPARPRGVLKAEPGFVVEEIPLYAPSGEGDHLYVRFRKRDRTTLDVVRELARQAGADPREAGVAGMKDRRAVTEQTISLFAPKKSGVEERLAGVAIDGVTVLDVGRHGNKLKTGHLAGNRFVLRVTGLADGDAERVAARLAEGRARARPTPSGISASDARRQRRAPATHGQGASARTRGSAACTSRRSSPPRSTPCSRRASPTAPSRRRSPATGSGRGHRRRFLCEDEADRR